MLESPFGTDAADISLLSLGKDLAEDPNPNPNLTQTLTLTLTPILTPTPNPYRGPRRGPRRAAAHRVQRRQDAEADHEGEAARQGQSNPLLPRGRAPARLLRLLRARLAALGSKRPAHWVPSHCLGCSSEPPPKPPMAPPLTIQAALALQEAREGGGRGGQPRTGY
eukprot:scaffold47998_cov33-Phaeocystis_antarctica.AAC.4